MVVDEQRDIARQEAGNQRTEKAGAGVRRYVDGNVQYTDDWNVRA